MSDLRQTMFRLETMAGAARDKLATGLDEHVHEAKAAEAATINNRGAEEQVSYLIDALGIDATREVIGSILEEDW